MNELPIDEASHEGTLHEAAPDEGERLILSARDFARLVEIIQDPAPPTLALVRAMAQYQETKSAHPNRGL